MHINSTIENEEALTVILSAKIVANSEKASKISQYENINYIFVVISILQPYQILVEMYNIIK